MRIVLLISFLKGMNDFQKKTTMPFANFDLEKYLHYSVRAHVSPWRIFFR
jgi:hypothetical protein